MAKKKAKKAAKKAVKKATKKSRPGVTKKAAPKKAAKKATKKAVKKATKKAAPKKAVKKAVKKVAKKSRPGVTKKAAKKASANKPVAKPEPKQNILNVYLTFNGNCEEAFNMYRSVFGGNFAMVSRFKEMPPQEGQPALPEHLANMLMHISLPISKETMLMGSDADEALGSPAITAGNNFSISISAIDEKEADRLYAALSDGGNAVMPMAMQFWGSYFGMLVDRFGINWMISAGRM
jgi:PhnB protein